MISIVMPAYNESGNIGTTITKICSVFTTQLGDPFEIIVVDDHSSDQTYEEASKLTEQNINVIRLSRRSGSHTALRVGIAKATGDAVICMAADGQDDPGAITNMAAEWLQGNEIVWALRQSREGEGFFGKIFSKSFYYALQKLTPGVRTDINLERADFFLLDRRVVEAVNACPEKNTSLFGLIAWMGFRQGTVEYRRQERRSGSSKWNFRSRVHLALDWIVGFSGLPLRLMTVVGAGVSLVGLIYAIHIVRNLFAGNPPEGWSSTMIVILVIGGLQMAMLGIIGEYLWKNLDESRRRPLFFVEKSTFDANPNKQKGGQWIDPEH